MASTIKIDYSPCLIVTVFESVNLFHNPYYALDARSHLFSAFHRHILHVEWSA